MHASTAAATGAVLKAKEWGCTPPALRWPAVAWEKEGGLTLARLRGLVAEPASISCHWCSACKLHRRADEAAAWPPRPGRPPSDTAAHRLPQVTSAWHASLALRLLRPCCWWQRQATRRALARRIAQPGAVSPIPTPCQGRLAQRKARHAAPWCLRTGELAPAPPLPHPAYCPAARCRLLTAAPLPPCPARLSLGDRNMTRCMASFRDTCDRGGNGGCAGCALWQLTSICGQPEMRDPCWDRGTYIVVPTTEVQPGTGLQCQTLNHHMLIPKYPCTGIESADPGCTGAAGGEALWGAALREATQEFGFPLNGSSADGAAGPSWAGALQRAGQRGGLAQLHLRRLRAAGRVFAKLPCSPHQPSPAAVAAPAAPAHGGAAAGGGLRCSAAQGRCSRHTEHQHQVRQFSAG